LDAGETCRFLCHPTGMHNLSKAQTVVAWVLQLAVAAILLQTLFFKFTGAEESVYIFSSVGQFLHVGGVEPWGRIGSGVVELIASLLLIIPATASLGAILTMGVMAGAIASHLVILGIEVKGDGGLLFGLAVVAFVGSLIVLIIRRTQIPVVGRHFELA
jgi:putative oxidoreductase